MIEKEENCFRFQDEGHPLELEEVEPMPYCENRREIVRKCSCGNDVLLYYCLYDDDPIDLQTCIDCVSEVIAERND